MKSGHRSLGRHLLRAAPVIIVVSLITLLLGHWGWLSPVETTFLDSWLRLKHPRDVPEIVIIEIGDEDYTNLFRETSPLDPAVLYRLIDSIAGGAPRLIGADLDTSSAAFENFQIPAGWPPVIWACDARQIPESNELEPGRVLGKPAVGSSVLWGLAVLPQDRDGVFRRYQRALPVANGRDADSFPWLLTRKYIEDAQAEDLKEPVVLNFSGNRYAFRTIRASHVLQLADAPGWKDQSPVRDKICLIGGTYRAARDEYFTALGPMAGVQLMAQAIATDLHHGGIHYANELAMIFFEMMGGFLLVIIHHRFRLKAALILSLLCIPFISLVASYAAFSGFGLWANAVPLLTAVLIHQLYDHAKQYQRMMKQLT